MLNNSLLGVFRRIGGMVAPGVADPDGGRRYQAAPRTLADPELIVRGNPGHSGHDECGFRNSSVMERADVCVLGGALAYGAGVGAEQCWPALLGWMTSRKVYNAALPGWGPMQAAMVLERQLERQPSRVVLTLNSGDARRAFLCALRSAHPLARRFWQPEYEGIAPSALLSKEMAARAYTLEKKSRPEATSAELLETLSDRNVPEFNRFELRASRFYLSDGLARAVVAPESPATSAGLELLGSSVRHVAEVAADRGVEVDVLLIPSREYLAFLRMHEAEVRSPESLRSLGEAENRMLSGIRLACEDAGLRMHDLSAPLARRLGSRIFPQDSRDGHPNPKGCRIIAETVNYLLAGTGRS